MKESNLQIEPDDLSSNFIVPISSLDRIQATCALLNHLLRVCHFSRQENGNISSQYYFEQMSYHIAHEIRYINMNACNFNKYMKFFGAIWWHDQFYLFNVDEDPFEYGLFSSIALLSDTNRAYYVVNDESFYNESIDETTIAVIIEMENNYGFLSSLVDGYMWAQGCESQVTKEYNRANDFDEAFSLGFDYITDKARIEFGLTEDELKVYMIPS